MGWVAPVIPYLAGAAAATGAVAATGGFSNKSTTVAPKPVESPVANVIEDPKAVEETAKAEALEEERKKRRGLLAGGSKTDYTQGLAVLTSENIKKPSLLGGY